jgi:hypothetical protein
MSDIALLESGNDFYDWRYEDFRNESEKVEIKNEVKDISDGINFRLADGRITSIGKNIDEYIQLLEARNSYKRFDRI